MSFPLLPCAPWRRGCPVGADLEGLPAFGMRVFYGFGVRRQPALPHKAFAACWSSAVLAGSRVFSVLGFLQEPDIS